MQDLTILTILSTINICFDGVFLLVVPLSLSVYLTFSLYLSNVGHVVSPHHSDSVGKKSSSVQGKKCRTSLFLNYWPLLLPPFSLF